MKLIDKVLEFFGLVRLRKHRFLQMQYYVILLSTECLHDYTCYHPKEESKKEDATPVVETEAKAPKAKKAKKKVESK